MLSQFTHAQLCNPMECSPPGSILHRVFQTRILEWVAMPVSRWFSHPRDRICISMSPALAGGLFTSSTTQEACILRAEKMVLLALLSRLLQVYSLSNCVINWSFFPIPQLPRCISPCLPHPHLPYCFFSCKEKSCPSVSEFFLFISSFIYYLINIQK